MLLDSSLILPTLFCHNLGRDWHFYHCHHGSYWRNQQDAEMENENATQYLPLALGSFIYRSTSLPLVMEGTSPLSRRLDLTSLMRMTLLKGIPRQHSLATSTLLSMLVLSYRTLSWCTMRTRGSGLWGSGHQRDQLLLLFYSSYWEHLVTDISSPLETL